MYLSRESEIFAILSPLKMGLYIAVHFVLVSGMEFLLWATDSNITFGAHFYFTCVGRPILQGHTTL